MGGGLLAPHDETRATGARDDLGFDLIEARDGQDLADSSARRAAQKLRQLGSVVGCSEIVQRL
jgi:hypothetical protein